MKSSLEIAIPYMRKNFHNYVSDFTQNIRDLRSFLDLTEYNRKFSEIMQK